MYQVCTIELKFHNIFDYVVTVSRSDELVVFTYEGMEYRLQTSDVAGFDFISKFLISAITDDLRDLIAQDANLQGYFNGFNSNSMVIKRNNQPAFEFRFREDIDVLYKYFFSMRYAH